MRPSARRGDSDETTRQPRDSKAAAKHQVSGRGQLAAAFILAVLAVAVTVLGRLVHRVLNRRRMAAWDADWLAYGPRWTRR